MDTAETWDSYEPTLLKVLKEFKPKRVLEWGSGKSTYTLAKACDTVDSVEHNPSWVKSDFPSNVNQMFEPDLQLYFLTTGRYDDYDLIFIDGRKRNECLKHAHSVLKDGGIVMLHDAERERYQEGVKSYVYNIFTDKGHTVTMTNSFKTLERLRCV